MHGQPIDVEAWESFEPDSVIGRFADGDEHRQTLRPGAGGRRRQITRCRLVVQPLRVVDDRQHRLGSSGLAEQAQHRRHDERTGRTARARPGPARRRVRRAEGRRGRRRGRGWDRQVDARPRTEGRLRLDAGDPQNAELRGSVDGVVEQCGFPIPGGPATTTAPLDPVAAPSSSASIRRRSSRGPRARCCIHMLCGISPVRHGAPPRPRQSRHCVPARRLVTGGAAGTHVSKLTVVGAGG